MNVRALFALLFCFAATALAEEPKKDPPKSDDPIAEQLLKDKEAYVAGQEKAREGLLKAFDKQYEAVKNNKSLKIEAQLAQLEKIEAEKKAFEDGGTLPVLPALKVGLSEYRTALKKVEGQCKAGFEKAAKAYRDKGDVKAAGEVLEEMKEFLAKAPGATAGGAFYIGSKLSSKVIGVRAPAAEGGKVLTADYVRGDTGQQWRTVPAKDGWVYVENLKNGLVLHVAGKGNSTDATLAKKKADDDQQLWKLVPVAGQAGAVKLLNKGSDKVIGVDGKSKNTGARIILWSDDNDSSQWFVTAPVK